MKKITLLLSIFVLSFFVPKAQNVAINSTGAVPNASSILDVSSPNKGVLVPRMSTNSRKSIANPATGLMVFDSITSVTIDPATEIVYVLCDNSVYDVSSPSKPVKIKKLAFDDSSPLPTLLSFFNKSYIVGNPSYTNMDKPFTGAFYFGITP